MPTWRTEPWEADRRAREREGARGTETRDERAWDAYVDDAAGERRTLHEQLLHERREVEREQARGGYWWLAGLLVAAAIMGYVGAVSLG
jgi:hypothetical protein